MNSQVLPRCKCCQEVPIQGLYDGIRIQGVLFCSECCHRIAMSSNSSIFYQRFFREIKNTLFL
nr:sigma factor G inhibitor Gin [Desulfitobacterium metallireducens]